MAVAGILVIANWLLRPKYYVTEEINHVKKSKYIGTSKKIPIIFKAVNFIASSLIIWVVLYALFLRLIIKSYLL